MESYIGCSASHPGQFCDKIDQDIVLISLYLVDLIYSRIPILKTKKAKTKQNKETKKKQNEHCKMTKGCPQIGQVSSHFFFNCT